MSKKLRISRKDFLEPYASAGAVVDWASGRGLLAVAMLSWLALPVARAASGPAAPVTADSLEVRVGEPFAIASSRGRTWFATIHQSSGGEIMVGYSLNADVVAAGLSSAYVISADGGHTWSHRYVAGDEADDSGGWSAAPEEDGAIWRIGTPLDPFPPGQSQQFHASLSKFWRAGRQIHIDREAILKLAQPMQMISLQGRSALEKDYTPLTETISGFPYGPILHARNGDLLAPIYYKPQRDPRYYRLGMIRSGDAGKTWTEYSTIAALQPGEAPWPWMDKEGPCEAGLVRLADGRLYAIYRTGSNGYMGQAWSSDDGATWTPPSPTPYKGVSPKVRRLSSGMLACTYGRPGPVIIMFDRDGTGEKWSHLTPIFSGMSTHYNDFIEIEPGKLLLVYDSVPYGWELIPDADKSSKNTIYGVFIEVQTR